MKAKQDGMIIYLFIYLFIYLYIIKKEIIPPSHHQQVDFTFLFIGFL